MTDTEYFVTTQWLAAHLTDPELVVVDCRFSLADPTAGRTQYAASHIPGAVYLDLNHDLSGPVGRHGGRHPLPNLEEFAAKLRQIGLSAGRLVVAYDDSQLAFAARLWWLLRYLGHDRVVVLDGGWQQYQQAGYPVTSEQSVPQPGDFRPHPRPELLAQIEDVQQRLGQPDFILIDSREPQRYRGEVEPLDPIAGHIPGAINYPWPAITDQQGYLRSPQALQTYWAELATATEVIVYCGSGVTACANLLALAIAGITSAKLYAGSWSDWCSYLLADQESSTAR